MRGHVGSWSQDGPKTPQDPPNWSQDGPKIPQNGAKMDPRPPDLEPKWSQDPQLGANMAPRSQPMLWTDDESSQSSLSS